MRHASSPRTLPDAASAHPGNDKLERQLDEAGLAAAREFGDALRRLKIPIGDLMSSPTYRALETIRIAKLGTARTADELGEAGMAMAPPGAPQGATPAGNNASTAWLKAQLGKLPRKGKNTFLITHFPNITSALGEAAKGLADGEAVVTRPDGGGGFVVVGRIKIEEWSNLDAR
jgi:phosphohistidine phosphatase SixA